MRRPSAIFGKRLAQLREKLGLTQEQLAFKTGLTREAISHYENSRRDPSIEKLVMLADFFKVTLDTLVGREEVESV